MSRRGMTLVEMLVATTATLILMAAVAQAFAVFGSAISGSRSVLDLDARMRSAAWRLRSDLAGITVSPLPPITPESAQGYLEIIEGPLTDYQYSHENTGLPTPIESGTTPVGPTDVDDVLLFTTRNTETPFIGRGPSGGTFESDAAEVAWFARPTPDSANPVTYTIYRKQLLVMGYVGAPPFYTGPGSTNSIPVPVSELWSAYYQSLPCDISARREGGSLIPNTLADLSRREARFLHDSSTFPFRFTAADGSTPDGLLFTGSRAGEDVILTDVLAFDVRVFDPTTPVVVTTAGTPLVPGDPDYLIVPRDPNSNLASGAYVDLSQSAVTNSFLGGVSPRFSTGGQDVAGSQNLNGVNYVTYDTWTLAYEANGINEDKDKDENEDDVTDEAFDGKDNDGNGLVDDPAEFETRPPYPYPLRGIEIRIRCYEPSSRQVRQVTVRHTFVPH